MGNQYSYPEAKSNQESLKNQVSSVASQMQAIKGVVSNFLNVENFGGETQRQIKAFMSEVVLGGIEASNLLIENVEMQHQNLINRFKGIDGADDTVIYDSRLTIASQQNDEYAKVLLDKANEINNLIAQANTQGVSGKKYDTGEIGIHQNTINTGLKELNQSLTNQGNIVNEATNLDQFINSVRQFINFMGTCQPSTYNAGALAGQPFYYQDYLPPAVNVMKNRPYEYFVDKSPVNMTTIEKYGITEKLTADTGAARSGNIQAKEKIEKFLADVARSTYQKDFSVSSSEVDPVSKRFSEYAVILDEVAKAKAAVIQAGLANIPIDQRKAGGYPKGISSLVDSLKNTNLTSSIFNSIASLSEQSKQTNITGHTSYIISPFNWGGGIMGFGDSEQYCPNPFKLNFKEDDLGKTTVDISVNLKHRYDPAATSGDGPVVAIPMTNISSHTTQVTQGSTAVILNSEVDAYFDKAYKDAEQRMKDANRALGEGVITTLLGEIPVVSEAVSPATTYKSLLEQAQEVYNSEQDFQQAKMDKNKFKSLVDANLLDNKTTVTVSNDGSVKVIPTMESYNIITVLNKGNGSHYTFLDLSDVDKLEQILKEYNKYVADEVKRGSNSIEEIKGYVEEFANPFGDPNERGKDGKYTENAIKAQNYLGVS